MELKPPEFIKSIPGILGVGIDVVARDRVERMLSGHGDRFLTRCFTAEEAEYCMSRRDPIPDLSVRLAAKEAGFKAIGARRGMGIGWREFEVVLDEEWVPWLKLHEKAKGRGDVLGVSKCWLSLTHEDTVSIAIVILT